MNRVFTDYVRSLITGRPPAPELFEAVWEKLRRTLNAEMRKRGLWNTSPGYLGIHGFQSWVQNDAFDELVADAFTFLLERLPSVKAQLRQKDNVEGFFFRGIRNFLYDSQKRHDPVGFRVFMVAQSAVRLRVDDGTLHVLEGDPGVRNDTILGVVPDADPKQPHAELDELVQGWSGELMPELVIARGRKVDEVTRRLATLLSDLIDGAVEIFAFQGLVSLMKSEARRHWSAIWAQQEGETAYEEPRDDAFPVLVRLIRPDSGVEEREAFGKLVDCVAEKLRGLDEDPKTRAQLEKLWTFLRGYAAESTELELAAELELTADLKAPKLPSRRRIATSLEIPRDRLKGFFETLGDLVEDCREAISGHRRSPGPQHPMASGAPRPMAERASIMTASNPKERLLRRSEEAALRHGRAQEADGRPHPPGLGDLFRFPETPEHLWAVLERDPEGRFRAVAADAHPAIGSADVAVASQSHCGALGLRCRFDVRLDVGHFNLERRIGSLEPAILEQARQKRAALDVGHPVGSLAEQETDREPEYQDLAKELAGAQVALHERRRGVAGPPDKVVPMRRPATRWASTSSPYALAAMILLVVSLALAAGLADQVRRSRQLVREKERAEEALREEQQRPWVHLPFAWLSPQKGVRGPVRTVTLTRAASHVVLVLEVVEAEPHLEYRLDMLEQDADSPIFSSDVAQSDLTEVSVVVPRRLLDTGEYRLHLHGLRGGQAELVGEYRVSLELD